MRAHFMATENTDRTSNGVKNCTNFDKSLIQNIKITP